MAVLALVVGCGKKRVNPTGETKVSLVGKEATFHDWSKTKPCDVEPKTVAGDLASTGDLLTEYLAQTVPLPDGGIGDDAAKVLVEGAEKLPPLLDATDKAVSGVPRCEWTKEDKVLDLKNKSIGLLAEAGNRIALAPPLVQMLATKQALKEYLEKLPGNRDAAKAEWCPAKPKAGAMADIYFAFENEAGATEWLFCDDCRVFAAEGTPPAFEAPAAMKKKPKDKPYLESAAKYPASDIQHPPKPGDKKPEAADGGTPEGADAGT